MKEKNYVKGKIGEVSTENFLIEKGYKLVTQNFSTKLGEIDIVAFDGNTLVFIEVKARDTLKFGRPSEAVDYKKQMKIRRTAEIFLIQYRLYEKCKCRFDVVEILGEKINLIKNAF